MPIAKFSTILRSPRAIDGALLLAILALGLALRLQYFFGVVRRDSLTYANLAYSLAQAEPIFSYDIYPFHISRLTVVLPLSWAYSWWGVSELTSVLWPLLWSLGTIVVGYFLGRLLFGRGAGLLAALLLALHSMEVIYATHLLPDSAFGFFLALAVLLFLKGDLARQGRWVWFFLTGISLGLGYYARPSALVMLLFFFAYGVLRRRLGLGYGHILLGLMVVFAAAGLAYIRWGGTFWHEWSYLARAPAEVPEEWAALAAQSRPYDYALKLVSRIYVRPWTWLFIIGALWLAWRKTPHLLVPVGWFGVLYLYLEFLSQYPVVSLHDKADRYMAALSVPLALVVGAFLARWLGAGKGEFLSARGVGRGGMLMGRVVVGAAVAYLVLGPPFGAVAALRFQLHNWETRDPRMTAGVLRTLPPRPIYTTTRWTPWLNFFLGYRTGFNYLNPAMNSEKATLRTARFDAGNNPAAIADAYVVHDTRYGFPRPRFWREVAAVNEAVKVYYAPRSWPARVASDMRLLPDILVGPELALRAYGLGLHKRGQGIQLALDWRPLAKLEGHPQVTIVLADEGTGRAFSHRATLGLEAQIPLDLWKPGALYREYYLLAAPELSAVGLADYALRVGIGDGPLVTVGLGPMSPPLRLYEAEKFEAVKPAEGPIDDKGWFSYERDFYSDQQAAITRDRRAVMSRKIKPLPPGSYAVTLRVYDYGGPRENRVAVFLNGVRRTVRWLGGGEGLMLARAHFPHNPGGDDLSIQVLRIGQSYAVVDYIAIEAVGDEYGEPILASVTPPRGPRARVARQVWEAERFEGVVGVRKEDYAQAAGWTAYAKPFYSGGRAAITKHVGAAMVAPIPELPPGDYRVTLAVYEFGSGGANRVQVTLNEVSQPLEWSGGPAGVKRVGANFLGTAGADELIIEVVERGQAYAIIDAVTVEPLGR